jgi:hypothetical protein
MALSKTLPESPVRAYYDGDPRLNRALQASLNREIAEKSEQVARRLAGDWGDYCERCGFIAGLKRAAEIAAETEKQLRD